jgi:hypothetical protein
MDDALGQDACLAGAGSRNDKMGPVTACDDRTLFVRQRYFDFLIAHGFLSPAAMLSSMKRPHCGAGW